MNTRLPPGRGYSQQEGWKFQVEVDGRFGAGVSGKASNLISGWGPAAAEGRSRDRDRDPARDPGARAKHGMARVPVIPASIPPACTLQLKTPPQPERGL
jgi:hypothetical protein